MADLAAPQPGLFGLQSSGQEQRIVNPLVQECLDAVTEHQRLRLLMKGEWFKGLLPLSSVRPEAVVQRIKGNPMFSLHIVGSVLSDTLQCLNFSGMESYCQNKARVSESQLGYV